MTYFDRLPFAFFFSCETSLLALKGFFSLLDIFLFLPGSKNQLEVTWEPLPDRLYLLDYAFGHLLAGCVGLQEQCRCRRRRGLGPRSCVIVFGIGVVLALLLLLPVLFSFSSCVLAFFLLWIDVDFLALAALVTVLVL